MKWRRNFPVSLKHALSSVNIIAIAIHVSANTDVPCLASFVSRLANREEAIFLVIISSVNYQGTKTALQLVCDMPLRWDEPQHCLLTVSGVWGAQLNWLRFSCLLNSANHRDVLLASTFRLFPFFLSFFLSLSRCGGSVFATNTRDYRTHKHHDVMWSCASLKSCQEGRKMKTTIAINL